jgi:thioredoxin-related protein
MVEKGYTVRPLPKIILKKDKQKGLFIITGYYDPNDKEIVLYVTDRHPKDVLRSLAHELIHHKQFADGRITPDMCDENQITKNDIIVPFEEEAYLKGNIAFRTWTEIEKNKE